ncbi:MAG: hypothetical protein HFI48_16790 [Lachnospiraceae bacterium]|nr:hypothetical protein [Lachnospiraceae bacterium]
MQKPTIKEYINQLERECRKNFDVPKIDIAERIESNNSALNKVIERELQDYFSLLDLGISVIVEMHYICKSKEFVYTSITAKLVSQLLSIRTLLKQGQMDAVKSIHRPFQEMMEIFFACLIDKDFAQKYGNPNVMYDNNDFWRKNINNNKTDKYINRIFDELNYPNRSKKEYFKRRENSRKFLSETLHASFNSTFSSYLMFTLDMEYSDNIFGKITTAYPMAMYELLSDICLLNAIFFLAVDTGKAHAFSKSDIVGPDKLNYNHFMKAYDTVYELYYEDLYKKAYDIYEKLHVLYKYFLKEEAKEEKT